MSVRSRMLAARGTYVLLGCLAAIPLCFSGVEAQTAGNVKRGALAATSCQACHGKQGEGNYAAGYPRLAGQSANYLRKQLQDYVSGARSNPVMSALAKTIDEQQRADVAAYFASLTPPYAGPTAKSDKALLTRGRLLVRTGDESKQLQACANCHGPDGSGEEWAGPSLVGQSGTYLATVIGEWKSGARKNDGGKQMAVVSGRLNDQDTAAVAAYFESLGSTQF
jgi:cytochrome c553